jgi:hypothetical protein
MGERGWLLGAAVMAFCVGCSSSNENGAAPAGGSGSNGTSGAAAANAGASSSGASGVMNSAGSGNASAGDTAAGGNAGVGDAGSAGDTTGGSNGGAAGVGGSAGTGGANAGSAGVTTAGGSVGASGAAGSVNTGGAGLGGSAGSGNGGGTSPGGAAGSSGAAGSGGASGSCPQGSTGPSCSVCVVYVDANAGSDTSDGHSWAGAKSSLQAGVDTAYANSSPCQVWVAQGSYVPSYIAGFGAANTATLLMRPGIALYGGFAGTETSFGARNVATQVTTISGEIGTTADTDNLTYIVTTANGSTLDGFTVTNGYGSAIRCSSGTFALANSTVSGNTGSAGGFDASGTGLYVAKNCTAVVTDSTFSDNAGAAEDSALGGAIYSETGGTLSIDRCQFLSNSASQDGEGVGVFAGGALFVSGPTTIQNSSFQDNQADTGGAIYASGNTEVDGCTFDGNSANVGYAGAIYSNGINPLIVHSSVFESNESVSRAGAISANSLLVADSTFTDNSAVNLGAAQVLSSWGGAIYVTGTLQVERSTFNGNTVEGANGTDGGAIYCGTQCTGALVSVTFQGNSALGQLSSYGLGGAVYFAGTALTLVDAVFANNSAQIDGGAIYNTSTTGQLTVVDSTLFGNTSGSGGGVYDDTQGTTFLNSILWGNSATTQGPQIFDNGSASTVRSCDIQGFSGGTGNINRDPLFVSTQADGLDLSLQTASPCIDNGGNADVAPDSLDLDGDGNLTEPVPFDRAGVPRIQNGTVDIGAYEHGT